MVGLLQIYFLFNLLFILIKCNPNNELRVQKIDQKLIDKQRQDTRDMCKIFNSEAHSPTLPTKPPPLSKHDKRKKELKLKEKKETLKNKKTRRFKRALDNVNPALNLEDELRVESVVDKIYDDLFEKGQKIAYRRKKVPIPMATKRINSVDHTPSRKPGRRFPFAPNMIEGGIISTPKIDTIIDDVAAAKPVRFGNAIVPYFIDAKTYDTHLAEIITRAFDYFEKATCVRLQRLREKPIDPVSLQNVTWLYISNPSGIRQCVHSNEKVKIQGVQHITFGYDCMSVGDISHEIMHVLGFPHEHVRPDRDQHITVLWENIKPGYKQYFEIQNISIPEGMPYDYASVMHYPPRAFSRNGKPTILTERGIKIGQRDALSEMDLEKISIAYSNECIKRNREYLRMTCPDVTKAQAPPSIATPEKIEAYFENRVWPYGIVTFQYDPLADFSFEEKENIKAVMDHISNQTCLQFIDLGQTKGLDEPTDGEFSGSDEVDTKEFKANLIILSNSEENLDNDSENKDNNDNDSEDENNNDNDSNFEDNNDIGSFSIMDNKNNEFDLNLAHRGDNSKGKDNNDNDSEDENNNDNDSEFEDNNDIGSFSIMDNKNNAFDLDLAHRGDDSEGKEVEENDSESKDDKENDSGSIDNVDNVLGSKVDKVTYSESKETHENDSDCKENTENDSESKDIIEAGPSLRFKINPKKFGVYNGTARKCVKAKDNNTAKASFMMRNHPKLNIKGKHANNGTNRNDTKVGATRNSIKVGATGNSTKVGATGNRTKVGATGNGTKVGASGNSTNIGARGKPTKVNGKVKATMASRKPVTFRRRRAMSPTRRDAGVVLVLKRSIDPGCPCPPPGKPQGENKGVLQIHTDCFNTANDLLHVFGHVLGLDHQHNMYDRNMYLHIEWGNLTEDVKNELKPILSAEASAGFPYDYRSVMHYPWLQIKNGATNIMYPVWNDGWVMGHWQGLSAIDVEKIQRIYQKACEKRKNLQPKPPKNDQENSKEKPGSKENDKPQSKEDDKSQSKEDDEPESKEDESDHEPKIEE